MDRGEGPWRGSANLADAKRRLALYTRRVTTTIAHTTPPKYPDAIASARFAAHIQQALPVGCRVAILGLADDLGVRLNRGRPGAKDGPRAFREALSAYGSATGDSLDHVRVFDAGDVVPADGQGEAGLHETHRRVSAATEALLDLGLFPIAIGGGHDLTFPFVRAVVEWHRKHRSSAPFAGVYFDAHLDVRESVGSGMPLRRIIEWCGVRELHNYGYSPLVNSREHAQWFKQHGGVTHAHEERGISLRRLPNQPMFASFDLDVIDMAFAPGVSAMNPAGWTPRHAEHAVMALGRDFRVKCFDLMELCPAHDDNARTARLAAHLFLSFLRGYAERPAEVGVS